jgi:predicted regulator of Ras-like GTPase activity (Roadblock/LC7/MglB family)
MNHVTIPAAAGQSQLAEIAAMPGVRHAAIIDSAGLCLMHAGHEPVSPSLLTDWTVLARSAFLASDDMGQRCGIGPCLETVQTHRDGGTLMHSMAGGMMLIVQHTQETLVGTLRIQLRQAAEKLPTVVEIKPRTRPATATVADPFAGNGWWSEQASSAPQRPVAASAPVVQDAELVEA